MKASVHLRASGSTLIELTVVMAIISVLSAILMQAYAEVRSHGVEASCISSARQLGEAVILYTGDFDEQFPSGLGMVDGERVWAGEGWGGQCLPYHRSTALFRCLADPDPLMDSPNNVVSYGYNVNLDAIQGDFDQEYNPVPPGVRNADLNASARTVLLFEVSGVYANLSDTREGADPGGVPGRNFSSSANGLDHRLYAQRDWTTRTENQYATGYLGGRLPPDPTSTQFASPTGRHYGGSTFVFCDAHARWMHGAQVSSGLNASMPGCYQDNVPDQPGCASDFHAAGTEAATPAATFSIR